MDAQIDSWELTTATNCGYCESSLNKASPSSGTIDSAEKCWLDCLRTYVNDDFDDETLWAIDWYPATKVCKCQSSCDTLGLVGDPVVVITRELLFPSGMLDADADAEPYARADAETDADADACADAETDASYYTVTGAGTDDVGIETTNCPRPIQGRAGRPAGSTRRTGLNGLTAIILCLLPFANGL